MKGAHDAYSSDRRTDGVRARARPDSPAPPPSPAPVDYLVRLEDAAHHTARITVTWRDLPAAPLRFQMARSSPSRTPCTNSPRTCLPFPPRTARASRSRFNGADPYGSRTAPEHDGTVVLTYTLFGDHGDGTYAQIDASHAHLNIPATLMWATGLDAHPPASASPGRIRRGRSRRS
ncbi:hypothetical protein AB5I41_11575 [Sphingomonas sp. MMS24-JH45]